MTSDIDKSVPLLENVPAGDPALHDSMLIIPLGATEQHGPHLPLATDVILAQEITLRAAAQVAADMPLVVAPCVPYGYSPHHVKYGQTMSVGGSALLQFLVDICTSAAQSGMRRLFLLNGHAGNSDILGQLGRHLSTLSAVPVGHGSYWTIAASEINRVRPDHIDRIPGHAGAFETSLMLALRPDLVRDPSGLPADPDMPTAVVNGLTIEQVSRRVGTHGYTDRPGLACAADGEVLLNAIVPAVARALRSYWLASAGY